MNNMMGRMSALAGAIFSVSVPSPVRTICVSTECK